MPASHRRSHRPSRRLGAILLTTPLLVSLCAGVACKQPPGGAEPPSPSSTGAAATTPPAAATPTKPTAAGSPVSEASLAELTERLVKKHGEASRSRIVQGLKQASALFQARDGDFAELAEKHFLSDPAQLTATLDRLEGVFEQLDGHLNEIGREWRLPSETELGPLLGVDPLLAAYDPSAHVVEDLFDNRLAFVVLLNFPLTPLAERLGTGSRWSRRQWAEVRLADRFARRVPGDVQRRITEAESGGQRYIEGYFLWLHHVLDENGERLFPKGLRLISHWNLRDQIRADYAEPKLGLRRQRLLARLMQRIVEQSVPAAVIDNPRLDWNVATNQVTPTPAAELEPIPESLQPAAPVPPERIGEREPDTRYARLLDNFRAQRLADPYSPTAPTLIARSFELGRELPESRVVAMLTEICSSPLVEKVAQKIAARLGRRLEPHDLWYAGFQPRARYPEAELDALVRGRYPNVAAFQKDLPVILEKLGFSTEKARFLAEHIKVDAARGAGHAMPALRRGDAPRLRTRFEKNGMDYKGYNIAIHELGHNVEQVFSLYGVDRTLLAGVPNNAFTEALAFVFQQRDLAVLGLTQADPKAERYRVLHDFFSTWEIAGVALVEIGTWHYLYDHPAATPAELRAEVVRLSAEIWNRYYAKILGGTDGRPVLLLGVYSHMIQNTLYLPDYPLGHLIAFQIEEHLRKQAAAATAATATAATAKPHGKAGPVDGAMAREFERMATYGRLTPDQWLIHATGSPLSAEPLLRATDEALRGLD